MALSTNLGLRRSTRVPEGMICEQARAGAVFRPGSAVTHRLGSKLAEVPLSASPRTDLVTLGTFHGDSIFTASSTADANGGALDADGNPQMVTIEGGVRGYFATGSGANQITADDFDRPCFWYDDDTLYLTDVGGTLPFAGLVNDVNDAGRVRVRMTEESRALVALYSAANASFGVTDDVNARAVVTALPVCTTSGGVLTVTATNSGITADGVTVAVGDIVTIPEGTTNLPAASDAGPYEVTRLQASGVKLLLTRPAGWQHGDVISQHARISVSGEGTVYSNTVWKSCSTAGLVVGTDAPVLYPNRVTQSVSLGGGSPVGHVAITNVPILSATKTNYEIRRKTATTPTLTLEYAPLSITIGALGTASVDITAEVAAGTINTADGSTLLVTVENF